jgi:TetR/AcrR family transcriptional repressor of nem operon
MPRVSKEQSDANRAAITAASARLFREFGIDGVSVADLMAAAGLTHGGFYGHFASKDVLAAEACGAAFAQSVERWRKRLADEKSPEAGRAALVEGYLSAKSRGSPGTSCPAATMAVDVAREPSVAPVRAAYLGGIEQLVAILASVQPTGAQPSHRGVRPAHRGAQPSHGSVQPVHRGAQPSHGRVQPAHRGAQPSHGSVQPAHRGAQPSHGGVQRNQREGALADLASMVGALLLARATAEQPISDEFLAAARKRLLSTSAPASAQDSAAASVPLSARGPRRGGRRDKPRRPAA